jgi:hypothetical protein
MKSGMIKITSGFLYKIKIFWSLIRKAVLGKSVSMAGHVGPPVVLTGCKNRTREGSNGAILRIPELNSETLWGTGILKNQDSRGPGVRDSSERPGSKTLESSYPIFELKKKNGA